MLEYKITAKTPKELYKQLKNSLDLFTVPENDTPEAVEAVEVEDQMGTVSEVPLSDLPSLNDTRVGYEIDGVKATKEEVVKAVVAENSLSQEHLATPGLVAGKYPQGKMQDGTTVTDGMGVPWNKEIHSSNFEIKKDMLWRKRRGISDAVYHSVIDVMRVRSSLTPLFGDVTVAAVQDVVASTQPLVPQLPQHAPQTPEQPLISPVPPNNIANSGLTEEESILLGSVHSIESFTSNFAKICMALVKDPTRPTLTMQSLTEFYRARGVSSLISLMGDRNMAYETYETFRAAGHIPTGGPEAVFDPAQAQSIPQPTVETNLPSGQTMVHQAPHFPAQGGETVMTSGFLQATQQPPAIFQPTLPTQRS